MKWIGCSKSHYRSFETTKSQINTKQTRIGWIYQWLNKNEEFMTMVFFLFNIVVEPLV